MEEIKEEKMTLFPQEEEPHRLSFSHLPNSESSPTPSPRPNLLFEFSADAPPPHSYHNDIVFCGKIIHDDDDDDDDEQEQLNEYQKRDYFATVKSKSLRKPSSPESDHRRLAASSRFSGELSRPKGPAAAEYHAQRVNITSLTSMSQKSRRRMFMFGPVKFKPEMELAAIKERQAKQVAEKAAGGGRKGQWEMLKSSFRGRSHLTSVLARSLGCIPVAVAGGDGSVGRRLGAAS